MRGSHRSHSRIPQSGHDQRQLRKKAKRLGHLHILGHALSHSQATGNGLEHVSDRLALTSKSPSEVGNEHPRRQIGHRLFDPRQSVLKLVGKKLRLFFPDEAERGPLYSGYLKSDGQ